MADLGAIGVYADDGVLASTGYDFFTNVGYPLTQTMPNKAHATGDSSQYQAATVNLDGVSLNYVANAQTYSVSGTVKENGVVVARKVRVFARATGVLLGETLSASNGAFSVPLIGFNGEVTVLAYDDNSGESFNVRAFDRVIPA